MAESSIIKEFLVKLGFVTDESALKKFGDGIERATKSVLLLSTAVTAAATTVAIGVERFAGNLDKLYFAAQRTGTSATNIKAFQRTIEDFGGSAQDAMASIEGLTVFLRNHPGGGPAMINSWLAQVGKSLTGDKAQDLASIGQVFAKNTREGNAYLNDSLASQWGISSATALEIQNSDFGDRQKQISDRLNNAGFEKATKDSRDFMRSLRETGDWLTILGTKILDVLQVKLGFSMDKLNRYLEANGDAIAGKIVRGVELFISLLDKLTPIIAGIIRAFEWLDKVSGGLSTTILGVLTLMGMFGGFRILSGLAKVGEAILGLARGWGVVSAAAEAAQVASLARAAAHFKEAETLGQEVLMQEERARQAVTIVETTEAMAASRVAATKAAAARTAGLAAQAEAAAAVAPSLGARAVGALGKASLIGTAGYAGYEVGGIINEAFPSIGEGVTRVLESLTPSRGNRAAQAELKYGTQARAGVLPSGDTPLAMLMSMGWTKPQAAGILANLQSESGAGLDPNSVGDGGAAYGIGQWHQDRQEAYGRFAQRQGWNPDIHGSTREQQMAFVNYELRYGEDAGARKAGSRIAGSVSAGDSAMYFSRLYERPGAVDEAAHQRAGLAEQIVRGNVHLESKTTINVASATPEAIREMERAQNRVNAENVRNLSMRTG